MSAPEDHINQKVEAIPVSTASPKSAVNVPNQSDIRTIKVTNVAMAATEKDVKEFFSFSGDIQHVEMLIDTEISQSQIAYVTFKDSQGANTAALLTGSNIVNVAVTITPAENYQLPPDAIPSSPAKNTSATYKKAEDVVSTMLAKGFILGKDAINKAKSFDERHQLSSNASAKVASIDRKMGLSDKLSIGTTIVNEKMREMDTKYQVSEKTKSAIAVAEQKASSAGTAIMSNPYVSSGASWVSNAITAVAKAAGDVSTMAKEKVEQAAQVEKINDDELAKKEDPKKEEPKNEEPKTEEPKKEEPKSEEPKNEEHKKEEPKNDETKKEEPKNDETKKVEPKNDEPKREEPKNDEHKKEELSSTGTLPKQVPANSGDDSK